MGGAGCVGSVGETWGCVGFIGGHGVFGIREGTWGNLGFMGDTGVFGIHRGHRVFRIRGGTRGNWGFVGERGGIWHIKNRPTAWLSNTQHTALFHGFGPSLDTYINIISSQ